MVENKKIYDVIIVGAGPAGLTAAIYAGRRTLKTLVISKDLGGQLTLTTKIENYPGIDLTDGVTLAQNLLKQAQKFGAEIVYQEVRTIKKENEHFFVSTADKNYLTRAVILAFGSTPRSLGIPGEAEFTGKGVSYCATCDAPLFRGKDVIVVGGGNSALDAALLLAKIAHQVYLIHRRDEFRGDEITQEGLKQAKNVKIILDSQVTEVKGNEFVESVLIKKNGEAKEKELNVEGVFIEIGYQAKTDWVSNLVELNQNGEIVVDKDCSTTQEGIFACGDVTDTPDKQIVIAAGQGAEATLKAYKYLSKIKGKKTIPDWG